MSLLQRDELGIVQTEIYFDDHTGETFVNRTQDVESLLERNKALRNAGWDGYNADRSYRETHVLPITILEQFAREGLDIFNPAHDRAIAARINDPALNGFRSSVAPAHGGHIIVKGAR